jgi:hypothetical protein
VRTLRAALAGLVVASMATAAGAGAPALRTLTRPCERGTARLKLDVGPLPRGVEIVAYDENGALIGTAAPFGMSSAAAGGIYQLSLPPALFHGDKIAVRLAAKQYGVPERAPTADEVRQASVACVPPPPPQPPH